MRTAVVGHVEWVDLVQVPRMPRAGDIVHGEVRWEGPGGGGAGAAGQLRKFSDETLLFTALGNDHLGRRSDDELKALSVTPHVAWRRTRTRRAFTHIDTTGERTITVLGERLGPRGSDPLPWDALQSSEGTYFTAGDEDALRNARQSRVLVATSRSLNVIAAAGVRLDALVGSAVDPDEVYEEGSIEPPPELVVMTSGSAGGRYRSASGVEQMFMAPPLDGPVVDRYGAGDSFAGGLTYALAIGAAPAEAVAFAARCGTAALRGAGPFAGQLTKAALNEER